MPEPSIDYSEGPAARRLYSGAVSQSIAIETADLTWAADGTPASARYGDRYHSAHGAFGQARHVFLGGNALPARWQGQHLFTVLETGFGLGVNFLATWQAWRDDPARCARLHFVSVEKHPPAAAALAEAHARLGLDAALAPLAAQLRAAWPPATPGLHRIECEDGRVVLTLAWGDAAPLLRRLALRADAIYLDGFAPACNPDMWSVRVMSALARLAAPGATLATYTAAGAVREALVRAGFAVERSPGFAAKRHMTRARRLAGRGGARLPLSTASREAIVIGAGLAGCAAAHALARRGFAVTLLDQAADVASAASGNPAGVFHPALARDDNPLSRLTRAAHGLALRQWRGDGLDARGLRWAACGALQLADPARPDAPLPPVAHWPAGWVREVGRDEAAVLCGAPVKAGGLWFPTAGWVDPVSLCRAWLAAAGGRIDFRPGRAVTALRHVDGETQVACVDGAVLAAPLVVVAAGRASAALLGLPAAALRPLRGQLSLVAESVLPGLAACLCGGTYAVPGGGGRVIVGATHALDREDTGIDPAEHRDNLERLARLVDGVDAARVAAQCEGRAAVRVVTRDRLPLVGRMPHAGGQGGGAVYCAAGFAGRGLLWSVLAGQIIAADAEGEPAPVEADLLGALDPARVLGRASRAAT